MSCHSRRSCDAEQGNASAQYKLAQKYMMGIGVSQDTDIAFEWYRLAAEQGHAGAQYLLSMESFIRAGKD